MADDDHPSRVMAISSSSVVTPIDKAFANAGRVFSAAGRARRGGPAGQACAAPVITSSAQQKVSEHGVVTGYSPPQETKSGASPFRPGGNRRDVQAGCDVFFRI